MANRQRRAAAGTDHQILLAAKDDGERESAMKAPQDGGHRIDRGLASLQFGLDEVDDGFGIGLGFELVPLGGQLVAQLAEILDDAVVNGRDIACLMRVGVGLVGDAMGGPAGVANADGARQWIAFEQLLKIAQLARSASAAQLTIRDGRNTGGIIAAIFQPLQCIHKLRRNRGLSENSDNSTHGNYFPEQ